MEKKIKFLFVIKNHIFYLNSVVRSAIHFLLPKWIWFIHAK